MVGAPKSEVKNQSSGLVKQCSLLDNVCPQLPVSLNYTSWRSEGMAVMEDKMLFGSALDVNYNKFVV